MGRTAMIYIDLFGPLRIYDESGRTLRPKLLKSRAILAILAATPGHCQSRSWLQSMLWQDRQPAQAMSSLRSALADIRRSLGDQAAALKSDHSEVSIDPNMLHVTAQPKSQTSGQRFLEGFAVPHAKGFEDWLNLKRSEMTTPAAVVVGAPRGTTSKSSRLFLASGANGTSSVTQMQCEALIDCIAKSTEDLELATVVDGRGRNADVNGVRNLAANAGCDLILISESAEGHNSCIARLKLLECETGSLIWSRSLIGEALLDLDNPSNVRVVADFIEAMTDQLVRPVKWKTADVSPELMAIAGMDHIFKLGSQNFNMAVMLLKRSFHERPTGCTLAWRAFLKTFLLGEREYDCREQVIEEGTDMARRALEAEPLNSMVLALCAHVEYMLHYNYEVAFDLSVRAISLNRCNPIAWASLGRAASFLGEEERGNKLTQYGAKLAAGTKYSFLVDSWASSAGMIAQDLVAARYFCESSHAKAPTFAPPLRFLSALFCAESEFDLARAVVEKLKKQEPDFSLNTLKDVGYPSHTLQQANILKELPKSEI